MKPLAASQGGVIMQIRTAEHYGMCFGVRDAIDLALRLSRQGPLTILGDLVHNPDVLAQMDAAGTRRARSPQDVQTAAVLLTAHGTAQHVKLRLREQGHQVHEAVCPLVKRAHLAAARLIAEDRHLVVVGQAEHVEVRGLVGELEDYTILLDEADLEKLAGRSRLGIVAQTTQPLDHVEQLVEAIRRRFPEADVRFIDTVCQPTKDRQEALRRLVRECDTVVVVGGADSNNSRKLAEYARSAGRPTYQVARASELRREWFADARIVGVTAGTSTPEHVIQEVQGWLASLAAGSGDPRRAREGLPAEQTVAFSD
jgi:4-hydroxy-3-methylbut-2-enyl diphosphate reductase